MQNRDVITKTNHQKYKTNPYHDIRTQIQKQMSNNVTYMNASYALAHHYDTFIVLAHAVRPIGLQHFVKVNVRLKKILFGTK